MKPLDAYLSRVAHELRSLPPSKRDEELCELRSHLEQRVEDFQQGLEAKEAQHQTLEAFGSPNTLGARLADAWEGIHFSWWRVVAACGVTTTIWVLASLVVGISMTFAGTFAGASLFPELFPLIMAFYLSVPPLCGALFTHWLGRRGRLFALIHFTLIFWVFDLNLHFDTSTPSRMTPPNFFINYVNSAWTPPLSVALGFIGAYILHTLRMRARVRLAEANGLVFTSHTVRLFRIPLNPRTWFRAALLYSFIVLASTARFWLVTHPSTPAAALRYQFTTGYLSDGFESPQFVELQELPPTTLAEKAGRERRVQFNVLLQAKPYFRANQLAHLKRQAATEARYGGDSRTREAIERVRANQHTVKGVARMRQTDKGWQFDPNSFDGSKLHAWFYAH